MCGRRKEKKACGVCGLGCVAVTSTLSLRSLISAGAFYSPGWGISFWTSHFNVIPKIQARKRKTCVWPFNGRGDI